MRDDDWNATFRSGLNGFGKRPEVQWVGLIALSERVSTFAARHGPKMAFDPVEPLATRVASPKRLRELNKPMTAEPSWLAVSREPCR